MVNQVIAISSDRNYLIAVETLIKSIAYNNHHVKVYLLNEDIPQEWFFNVNRRLAPTDVRLIDTKFYPGLLKAQPDSIGYITKMGFARLLIPQLIPEKRVLYLDADIIVDGDLSPLFDLDLQGKPIGAAREYFNTSLFNSGVMLMDNEQLQQTDFVNKILERSRQNPGDPDQDLLNDEIQTNFFPLPPTYNVQVGGDVITTNHPARLAGYEEKLKAAQPFTIIHFTTPEKPWLAKRGRLREREKFWQYWRMTYPEIVAHRPLPTIEMIAHQEGAVFTFTFDQRLMHFDSLVSQLPNVRFNVASPTLMGNQLSAKLRYRNVRLFPAVSSYGLNQAEQESIAYLDINDGEKNKPMIQKYLARNIPVLAFDSVATQEFKDNANYQVFADADLSGFVAELQNLYQPAKSQPSVNGRD